jgi:hypothetical protein
MTFNDQQRKRFQEALLRLAGDEQMLSTLAEIVIADAPGLMEQISRGVAEKNCELVARSAHALKGLLSSFETGEPTNQLQPIIDAARRGEIAKMLELFEKTQPKLVALIGEIDDVSGTRTREPA